jgi:predicted nucleic acid-binding protein
VLVVCDTTPLNYLIQIDLVDLIPRLFVNVCIPHAVLRELSHPAAPSSVRQFAFSLPSWVSVQRAGRIADTALLELDPGEREAIALATTLGAQFLLTDDYRARITARERGLISLTTLLILDAAADRGWISFRDAIDRLLKTNFRVDRLTIELLLEKHR